MKKMILIILSIAYVNILNAQLENIFVKKNLTDDAAKKYHSMMVDPTPVSEKDNIINKRMREDFTDVLLIADWTGSMDEYMPQVLHYQHLKGASMVKDLSLFNDGDDHPDGSIGNSGGIYFNSTPSDYVSVANLASKVQKAGSGGDGPENDLEAVIKATKYFAGSSYRSMGVKPDGKVSGVPFKKVVLVADGDSRVRDISLLSQISYPVHCILCKNSCSAASDYLQIAYETGGSVSSTSSYIDFSSDKSTYVEFNGKHYERQSDGSWK